MHEQTDYITLTEAAKIAPGRPSTNCLWRWCRRGVLARCGQRIKLSHVRLGGRVFTTARWIEDFGRALAEADAQYFDGTPAAAMQVPGDPRSRRSRRRRAPRHTNAQDEVERELEEAGL